MSYTLQPIYQRQAFAYINATHRHHQKPQGWLFGASAVSVTGEIVGVICVGRAGARNNHELTTCEATRVCATPGLPTVSSRGRNHAASVCSMLYAAAWRAAREIGYRRMLTYLLLNEPAITLKALKDQGWKFVRETDGGSWDRPSRRRVDKHPTEKKQLWEVRA